MKVLNLYACLGGNRYKWDEVADNLDITAVELDPELARMYQERFPNDKVIIADAHQYLLDHYKEFDFIWSSPPCPSHSRARFATSKYSLKINSVYPDMTLYQEIIFLDNYFNGKYCVENVIPFYIPLIPAQKRGRHLYWTNFILPYKISNRDYSIMSRKNEVKELCKYHEYNFYQYSGTQRIDKIARNLVDYEAGKTILETALRIEKKQISHQIKLEL